MMRRPLVFLAALAMAFPLFAGNRSVSFDDESGLATDCSSMSVRFDDQRVPVIAEDVAVGNVRALKVSAARHGGIRVIGASGGYSVRACKAAAPGVDPASVRVRFDGNEVTATGPDDGDWTVFFIVQTPANATLDVSAKNGPVSVRDFSGTLTANTENGPLALRNSSGTIDATAHNGPISISGGSGNVKLSAQNGPISVKLDGSSWDGGNLDASTNNGPVSLKIPRGFRSGVVVESLGHGPVSCRAEDCVASRQTAREDDWDRDRPRRIELGSGAQVVHLSSVNGPVSVKDRD